MSATRLAEESWARILGSALLGLGFLSLFFSAAGVAGLVMGAALYSLGFANQDRRAYLAATLSAFLWVAGSAIINVITRHEFSLTVFPGEPLPGQLPFTIRVLLIAISLALLGFSVVLKTGERKHAGWLKISYAYYICLVVAAASLLLYLAFSSTTLLYGALILSIPPLMEAVHWLKQPV